MPRNRGYQTEELKKEKAMASMEVLFYLLFYLFISIFKTFKHFVDCATAQILPF